MAKELATTDGAIMFSLSPRRGVGRGEGWECGRAGLGLRLRLREQRSEATLDPARNLNLDLSGITAPHPQSLSQLRGEGSMSRGTRNFQNHSFARENS
jgi:hypothetical protein